jgi:hypothetical protein
LIKYDAPQEERGVTEAMMPLVKRHTFTNKGSRKIRRRKGRRGPRVEAPLTQAVEEELPSAKILDTKKRRVKFKKNLVIMCELID